jgi:hypothetical protein
MRPPRFTREIARRADSICGREAAAIGDPQPKSPNATVLPRVKQRAGITAFFCLCGIFCERVAAWLFVLLVLRRQLQLARLPCGRA